MFVENDSNISMSTMKFIYVNGPVVHNRGGSSRWKRGGVQIVDRQQGLQGAGPLA